MPTIKVSEATPTQLDWLVAKCEEAIDRKLTVVRREDYIGHPVEREVEYDSAPRFEWWHPTTNPAQMWPIIEREQISIRFWDNTTLIHAYMPIVGEWEEGATGLTAAARCYVTSKLGETVEIPEELA